MDIDHVRNIDELHAVLQVVYKIFPQLDNGEYRYSRDFWIEKMHELPELLLYVKEGAIICGSVFAWVEHNGVTIGHCGIAPEYRGKGIGRTLMVEVEKRVTERGYQGITLGAVESAEGFYAKLGYTGSLLVQSEEHSVDELVSFNKTYEVIGTNVYNGTVSQVWLRLPLADREFQKSFEAHFPGCNTQMVFGKAL